ncbi:MAG: hypothetical protein U0Q07_04400 [Acidimicrobiales bacterium]
MGVAAAVLVAVVGLLVLARGRTAAPPSVDDAIARQGGVGTTSVPAPSGPARPSPGVYTATGRGTERLSLAPAAKSQGPTLPVAVTLDGDACYVVRVDQNTDHWQSWRYCRQAGGTLAELGGQTFQRTDIVVMTIDNTSTFVCEPPSPVLVAGAPVGSVADQRCTGTSSAQAGEAISAGPQTVVADEDLAIGSTTVRTRHVHQERTLSGAQRGTERADTWWTADGLPVRNERRVEVASPSPIGDVTYSEEGSWQLDSITPR